MKVIFLDVDGVLNHEIMARARFEKRGLKIKWKVNNIIYKIKCFVKGVDYIPTVITPKMSAKHKTYEFRVKRFKEETDPRILGLLNETCKNTGAKLVISSSWRNYFTLNEWNSMFKELGYQNLEVDGVTERLGTIRGEEIEAYLIEHDYITDYVILDDDSDMLPEQRNNFFWCDPWCGCTHNILYQVQRFFEGHSTYRHPRRYSGQSA